MSDQFTESVVVNNTTASVTPSAALDEFVSSLGLFDDDAPAAATETGTTAPTAPAADGKAAPEDDLSDLDDDSKPFTAERAKEIKARLVAARDAARETTRKANAASARARAQEDRFGKTKSKTLELKESVEARATMLTAIERGLTSGDKATVLETLGHLSKKDPLEFWTEISQAVAGGKVKKNDVPPEILAQLTEMRQQLQELAQAPVTRQQEQVIEQLKDQLVTVAASPEAAAVFPLVARFAAAPETRGEIRTHLHAIKVDYFNQYGQPLDNGRAFGILEGRLKAHSELFQPVHASNAQATDEKRTTSPALGEPAAARTEAATQAPSSPPRSTIPANLSERTGGTRRAMSEAERIAEIARNTPAQVFRDMGLGSLLHDGEE